MKKNVFSVRDLKAQEYGPLFLFGRDEEAVRFVSGQLSDPRSTIAKYPDDFVLYRVGVFDDGAGAIVGLPSPVHVANCSDLVKKPVVAGVEG